MSVGFAAPVLPVPVFVGEVVPEVGTISRYTVYALKSGWTQPIFDQEFVAKG